MSSMDISPLTLDKLTQIAKETGNVWVVNYTDQGRQQSRGDFFMEVVDSTNQSVPLKIPSTWIPINLATFIQVADLLKSTSFLNAIRRQTLVGISPADAAKLLALPSAAEEQRRVAAENADVVGAQTVVPNKITLNTRSSGMQATPPTSFANSPTENNNPSDALLKDLVKRFNANQISEDHAEEALDGFSPLPSRDALIAATEAINFKNSAFFRKLSEKIDEASEG